MATTQAPALAPLEAPGFSGAIAWARRNFFSSTVSALLSICLLLAAAWIGPGILEWALLDAVFVASEPAACRAASGACWAVVGEKYRLILFGTYPYEEQWRGAVVALLLTAMVVASTIQSLWSKWLLVAWAAGIGLALILQLGGIFGLPHIPTSNWGGLPLTLLLFVGTVVAGLPLAILLALGRRSEFIALRAVSTLYIEVVRGIPLVNVLFMATLMFPLFVPEGLNFDKLLRAQIGLVMFFGAYTAEVVRGGLQAIPRSQYEAADSLGVSYWQRTSRIILPQSLRIVIPALVNDIIRAFKNTSLLAIIGILDLVGGTMAALQDPDWSRYYVEAYLFTAAIFFAFCLSMSQYSQHLERHLSKGAQPLMPEDTIISVTGLWKSYGAFPALKGIDLEVLRGERVVICGPSGSGKSTLIRCFNALERGNAGRIVVSGVELNEDARNIRAVRRLTAMVFQNFALFPHLTVLENLTFAPVSVLRLSPSEADARARAYLGRVQMAGFAEKYPGQLSGGQQQRVAIARALAMEPQILLFDEPTSSLDPEMIKEVLDTMVEIAGEGRTMVVVTHEMGFARAVADRIIFMDAGTILEQAKPEAFFGAPAHARTRQFLSQILDRQAGCE